MIKFNIRSTKPLTMKKSLFTALVLFAAIPLAAQFSVGAFYNYHHGLSDYGENLGASPQGVSIFAQYSCSESPLSLGIEIGQSTYNQRNYGYTFRDDHWGLVTTDVKQRESITQLNLVARYALIKNAALEPYAEGKVGTVTFATTRCISDGRSVDSGEEVMDSRDIYDQLSPVEHHSTSFRAGIGLGTVVNLKRLLCETVKDYGFELKLDMGVTYYLGTNSVYSGGSNEVNQPVAHRSMVNDLNWRMGILLGFD